MVRVVYVAKVLRKVEDSQSIYGMIGLLCVCVMLYVSNREIGLK